MDATEARRLFERQLRQGQGAPTSVVVERAGRVVRELSAEPDGWAAVVWSGLDDESADQGIDDQLIHFARLGRPFEWKLYDGDQPADLGERLRARGFRPEEPEALMIAAIADLDLSTQPVEADVVIGPVTDRATILAARASAAEAFGHEAKDVGPELLARALREPEHLSVIVARAGDEVVATSRTEYHPGTGFASLWGGGVVPRWRGRGVYRAMVAARARAAVARGYSHLRVDALPTSEPILTRLGFVRAGTTTPYQSPGQGG